MYPELVILFTILIGGAKLHFLENAKEELIEMAQEHVIECSPSITIDSSNVMVNGKVLKKDCAVTIKGKNAAKRNSNVRVTVSGLNNRSKPKGNPPPPVR